MDLATAAAPADEGRHPPAAEQLWNESWYFDFTTEAGDLGGYVRLGLYPALGVSWFWACLVGEGRPLVTVVDHEAPLPKAPGLELRTEGLWTSLNCESPLDHWSIGLEAFGVGRDDPAEAYGDGRGERTALGLDLEWETVGGTYAYPGVSRYEVPCRVHGEVLVGRETLAFDGWGERDHSWGTRDWWAFPWCWTAGRLDDGTMWHASRPVIEGVRYEPGFVQGPGGMPEAIDAFTVTDELGRDGLPIASALRVGPLELAVTPERFAPVRLDAPDGRIGRLPRALSRATTPDGRAGWCWMEWNQPPT
ncbi:hypothetical protein BH18ACT1_BH18ACT1_16230 [soil metagenome]